MLLAGDVVTGSVLAWSLAGIYCVPRALVPPNKIKIQQRANQRNESSTCQKYTKHTHSY